jgi:hypothetical protein
VRKNIKAKDLTDKDRACREAGRGRPDVGGIPHPLGVFWKSLRGKELREGVCEICAGKGLRARSREVKEVEDVKEVKDGGASAFMTCSAAMSALAGIRRKNSGSGRSRRELLLDSYVPRISKAAGCCQVNNISCSE